MGWPSFIERNILSPMATLNIDIWSDIACPWCWIGKQRLDGAVEQYTAETGVRVIRRWHAFELNPLAPVEAPDSVNYAQRLAEKYKATLADAQAMIDRMVAAGREDGLELRFDRIRPSRTFDAHRLLAHVRDLDQQAALKERLFQAYLHEGRSISDQETLIELATREGLDAGDVRRVLGSDIYSEEVRTDERVAAESGITGVPFFVIGKERFGLSGAQPAKVLLGVMHQSKV